MKIVNSSQKTMLADHGQIADSFISRMNGLLGRSSLNEGEGLIITRCQSIHMFFMKFSIDAIFINKNQEVVGLVRCIKPFQLSPVFFKADSVIELPQGTIDQSRTTLGDKIDW